MNIVSHGDYFAHMRACLERSIFKGISKDCETCILLTSPIVWNEGMKLPVPLERFPSLIKTQEFLHPLLAKVFAEDRGARTRARERAPLGRCTTPPAPRCTAPPSLGLTSAWSHPLGALFLGKDKEREGCWIFYLAPSYSYGG